MEKGMINLLCVISTLRRCSPNQVLLNILRRLDRQQITPTVLTLSPEPADSLVSEIEALQIEWASLGLSRLRGIIAASKQLRQFVKQYHPHIIQTHGVRADWLAATALKGIPRIARMDSYPYVNFPMAYGTPRGLPMAVANVWAWQRVEQVIACSHAVAEQIWQHQITPIVIPNGVDTSHFAPASAAERFALREQLGLPACQYLIVSVGWLAVHKDPQTLIKAFQQSRLAQALHLVFVGDGPLRAACEQLAAGHPHIHFVGRVNNVRDYLRAADLFCSASPAEGLPNAVLEAIACGLPVCLSDIAPHREILAYRQGAGVTFPAGDVARLTALFTSVPGWDLSRMGQAARAIATEHLSAERMAAAYQHVYESLCRTGSGAEA